APPVQSRADGKLRVADVNPNTAGVAAIARALELPTKPTTEVSALDGVNVMVVLGDVLDGVDHGRLRERFVIALTAHERNYVAEANIAMPIAAWAEVAGTVTNVKGRVQRMHAAFPPPGQAIAGWEAAARLAPLVPATAKLSWTHVRDVFKEMSQAVGDW